MLISMARRRSSLRNLQRKSASCPLARSGISALKKRYNTSQMRYGEHQAQNTEVDSTFLSMPMPTRNDIHIRVFRFLSLRQAHSEHRLPARKAWLRPSGQKELNHSSGRCSRCSRDCAKLVTCFPNLKFPLTTRQLCARHSVSRQGLLQGY